MTFPEFLKTKQLSRREVEVTLELVKGRTNKEVANALFVTEKTVKFHLTSVYKKLALKSRSNLIVLSSNFKTEIPVSAKVEPGLPEPESIATRLHPGAGNA